MGTVPLFLKHQDQAIPGNLLLGFYRLPFLELRSPQATFSFTGLLGVKSSYIISYVLCMQLMYYLLLDI